jgi:hypothetical protein
MTFQGVAGGDGGASFVLNQTGNCNSDSRVDLSDGIFLLSYLFTGGPAPLCADRCRFNSDSYLDVADAISILDYLMKGVGTSVPLVEICGDGVDNDCNNLIDEDCQGLDLAWNPVVRDVNGNRELVAAYRIYVSTTGLEEDYVFVKEVTSACACATLEPSLLPGRTGKTRYLSITAVDRGGNESDFSVGLPFTW